MVNKRAFVFVAMLCVGMVSASVSAESIDLWGDGIDLQLQTLIHDKVIPFGAASCYLTPKEDLKNRAVALKDDLESFISRLAPTTSSSSSAVVAAGSGTSVAAVATSTNTSKDTSAAPSSLSSPAVGSLSLSPISSLLAVPNAGSALPVVQPVQAHEPTSVALPPVPVPVVALPPVPASASATASEPTPVVLPPVPAPVVALPPAPAAPVSV